MRMKRSTGLLTSCWAWLELEDPSQFGDMVLYDYCMLGRCPPFHHSAVVFEAPKQFRELKKYVIGGIFYWNISMKVL